MGDRIQVLMDQVKPEPAVGDKFVSIDGTEYVIHECDCWTHGCHDKGQGWPFGPSCGPHFSENDRHIGCFWHQGGEGWHRSGWLIRAAAVSRPSDGRCHCHTPKPVLLLFRTVCDGCGGEVGR